MKFFLVSLFLFFSTSAFSYNFEKGDNAYYCYTYKYWWDTRKSSALVSVEDKTETKYKVEFLEGVYNPKNVTSRNPGDIAWVYQSRLVAYKSACDDF